MLLPALTPSNTLQYPNTLLFPDTSERNLFSQTASSIALVHFLYRGENHEKTFSVIKWREKAE